MTTTGNQVRPGAAFLRAQLMPAILFFLFVCLAEFGFLWMVDFSWPFVLAGIAVLLTLAIDMVLVLGRAWRRPQAMQALAAKLGFSYEPFGDPCLVRDWSGFQLFCLTGCKSLRNLLRGSDGKDMMVFDYERESFIETKKAGFTDYYSSIQEFTIVQLTDPVLDLPIFALRPRDGGRFLGLLTKAGLAILKKLSGKPAGPALDPLAGIEFDYRPDFSRLYQLYVPPEEDKQRVRNLFTKEVFAFFEKQPTWSVEANGRRLIVYPGSIWKPQRVKPERIPHLLQEARKIAALFRG